MAGAWGVIASLVPAAELPALEIAVGCSLIEKCTDLRNEADALRDIVEDYAEQNARDAESEDARAQKRAQADRLGDGPERDLVTIMAVCHTVVPETLEDGTIAYRAESPDEEALVKGAAELGMKFTARSTEGVEVDGKRYLLLATIPFNSTRKRMSALVQGPDGKARILCKAQAWNITMD